MKKCLLLVLTILLAMATRGYAQVTDEILKSKMEKIVNGRALLLEKFLEKDYDKVLELKEDLLELEDDSLLALAPMDLWHLMLWTQEYDALTGYLRQFDSTYYASFLCKLIPGDDQLRAQLYRSSVESENILRFNIGQASISVEDKALLNLLLDWDLQPLSYQNQYKCNNKVEKFLKDYPNSDYKWFLQNVITIELSTLDRNRWAWGMGLNLCGGFVKGKLSETMTPIVGLGLYGDFAYKRLLLELGYDIVLSKTKVDLPLPTGVYKAGSHNELFYFYLDAAYAVVLAKEWSVSPMVGVGGCWKTVVNTIFSNNILSYDEIGALEHFYPVVRAGLMLDIKTHGAFEDGVVRIKYHCGLSNYGGNVSAIHMFSVGGAGLMNFKKKH